MLDYNQDQVPTTPVPTVAPATANTISVEQVIAYQPKHKWWLIILLSTLGILIIGGGAYAFLFTDLKNKLPFFSKPVENVNEVVNPEPVVENNDLATTTISENVELKNILQSINSSIVLCLDQHKALSKPLSGALICDGQNTSWPELIDNYQWSNEYVSNYTEMTWNYCVYHEITPDIFCDQTGCKKLNCNESILKGKKDPNEVQVNNLDTDQDGLSDDQELNIYQTDINNFDTDGDGYKDGDEVKNGYNPLGEGKINLVGFVTPQAALDNFLLALDSQDVSMLKKSFYNSEIRDDFNEASPKDAQEFLIQWKSVLEKSKWKKMEIKILGTPYQSEYLNGSFPNLPENSYLVEIEYLADGKKVGSERQLILIKLEDGSWQLYGFD